MHRWAVRDNRLLGGHYWISVVAMQRLMTGTDSKALTRAHLVASSLIAVLDTPALTDYMLAAVPPWGFVLSVSSTVFSSTGSLLGEGGKCSETN